MALTPGTIDSRGAKKHAKRLGRGNASHKGTSAGRGTKGQKARSSGKRGTARRGLKPALQKIPKQRGFKSIQAKPATVTLRTLSRLAQDGDMVTPAFLAQKGVLINASEQVKVVATGELNKKITLKNCLASKQAAVAIEKAGGQLVF